MCKAWKKALQPCLCLFPHSGIHCACIFTSCCIFICILLPWKGFMQMNRLKSVKFRWSVALQFLFPSFLYNTFTVLFSDHSDCIIGKAPHYPAVNSLLSHFSVSKNDSAWGLDIKLNSMHTKDSDVPAQSTAARLKK